MTRVKDRFILILIINHLRQSKPLLVFAVSVSVSLLVLVSDLVMDQWPRPTVVVWKSEKTGPGAGTSCTTSSTPISVQKSPVETSLPVQTSPVETTLPVQTSPRETTLPVQTSQVETSLPVQTSPLETSLPVQTSPVETTLPVQTSPLETSLPVQTSLVETTLPVQSSQVETTLPVQTSPLETSLPVQTSLVETTLPVQTSLVETTLPVQSSQVETTLPVQTSPVETTLPVQTSPVETTLPVQTSPLETSRPVQTSLVETTLPVQSSQVETSRPVQTSLVETSLPVQTSQVQTAKEIVNTIREKAPFTEIWEKFQPIDDTKAWVYSAYYDKYTNNVAIIRLIGIASRSKKTVYCHVVKNRNVTITTGKHLFLAEHHKKRYTATMFECVVEQNFKPTSISITYKPDVTPTNLLEIQYPKQRERNFTVCYPALFGYNNISRIIQAIEINRVLGAQHFFIYNYSISREMDAVLRHYQDEGVLTVLQWPLPLDDVMDVWYYAQMSAINDCVYRNKFVSQYVVIQDPDEFIIPNHHMTWSDLIEAAELEYQSQHNVNARPLGSFTFESAYFKTLSNSTLWEKIKNNFSITTDEENFFKKYFIFPFNQVVRQSRVYKFPTRTKTIVRPEHILVSGIHYTQTRRNRATYTVVSNDLAIVHHYWNEKPSTLIDTSALRFKQQAYPLLTASFERFSHLLKQNDQPQSPGNPPVNALQQALPISERLHKTRSSYCQSIKLFRRQLTQ